MWCGVACSRLPRNRAPHKTATVCSLQTKHTADLSQREYHPARTAYPSGAVVPRRLEMNSPRNANGRRRCMLDQGMRETGQNDDQEIQTFTVGYPNIPRCGTATDRMLAELEE